MKRNGMISKEAIDLIIYEEISSKEEYNRKYRFPEWPGGASGITIGIGYDLGYCTRTDFLRDWAHLPESTLELLSTVIGLTGPAAAAQINRVRHVDVPWDIAYKVFSDVDMPKWERTVLKHIPAAKNLSSDCLGVLVSIAYNRGASFELAGDRYLEMRNIKELIQNGHPEGVPEQIRSMKRLWVGKGLPGLLTRREHEAKLFEQGLTKKPSEPSTSTTPEPEQKSLWDNIINFLVNLFNRKV